MPRAVCQCKNYDTLSGEGERGNDTAFLPPLFALHTRWKVGTAPNDGNGKRYASTRWKIWRAYRVPQLDLLSQLDVRFATTDNNCHLSWYHRALSVVLHLPLEICRQSQPRGAIETLVTKNGPQRYSCCLHLLVLRHILW